MGNEMHRVAECPALEHAQRLYGQIHAGPPCSNVCGTEIRRQVPPVCCSSILSMLAVEIDTGCFGSNCNMWEPQKVRILLVRAGNWALPSCPTIG